MSSNRTVKELMDELAQEAMLCEVDDQTSLAACIDRLALLEAVVDQGNTQALSTIVDIKNRLTQLLGQSDEDATRELDLLREEITKLQDILEIVPLAEGAVPTAEGQFVLPEWVEEDVFYEFISGQKTAIEDIESNILALEDGEAETVSSLRRSIHTLKGESGILGLEKVEELCHVIEDHLAGDTCNVDSLLAATDWMAEAFLSYSRKELPLVDTDEIIQTLKDPHPNTATKPEQDASPYPAATVQDEVDPSPVADPVAEETKPTVNTSVEAEDSSSAGADKPAWDEDSLEIVAEFLQEAEEGVTAVDAILLGAQDDGVAPDQVDHMFRVFHTIKGVAGFLELGEITSAAHTTETLLDLVRKGDLAIKGAVLDLVFDSTELMSKMLSELSQAVSQGSGPPSEPGLAPLLRRLEAVIEGQIPIEEDLPEANPGDRLGEILPRNPTMVPPAMIEECLESQANTGRRLGEEIVARKAAKPKQVSQALRAQRKAETNAGAVNKLKEVVKVDLERVDSLVSLIGELVIVEAMIVNAPELSSNASPWLRKHISQMSKITSDLQDIGTRMRMVPVRGVFQKMARMVRDLSRKNGKLITAELSGEGTEMDRSMVEQIGDPLVHMIRNAVDHGIEETKDRETSGKPRQGTVNLRAYHQGGSVVIEVADDGKGLNRDAILAKAWDRGILKQGEEPPDSEIYNLIFAPGFSTAKKVTEISGRGVGMDVVRRNIETIRGRVKIDSFPGKGSTFTIVLPLTMAIIDGMLITCGGEQYIIPTLSVVESIKPDKEMVFMIAGSEEVVSLRGETLPLYRLDRLLGVVNAIQNPTEALVVVLESHGRKIGLLVDDVLTQQQVVIKGLGDGLPGTRYLSGAAIMSDGRVGLILNPDEVADLAKHRINDAADSNGTRQTNQGAHSSHVAH